MGKVLEETLWELLKNEALSTDKKTKQKIREAIEQAKQIVKKQKNDC